jgi:Zn-dependent M16 (insulinase) family peptidase
MLKQQIRTKTHLLFFRADNCRSHKRSIASSFTRRQLLTSTATVAMVLKQSERDRVQSIASQQKEVREFEKGESLKQLTRLKVGDVIANGAFEVTATETVDDYQIHAVSLRHLRTGAKWLHVGADDSNNAFNVGFKTVPMDDTGVAHILEHTTLCGSKKYPIRDPFFNMLRRSLSTFMNAMTSADFTCYPFATMNRTDYDNLLSVYLDAVFFPKLEEQDFRQEGHRFEFDKTEDASSGLKYKGVVFNEMKGAMGSQSARFSRALGANLFPTSTFHYNSGGDPTAIPDLTYEQLKAFHALHYHPSNARFYTYGDFPLEETLLNADTMALNQFSAIDVSKLDISDEKRYLEPVMAEVSVPRDSVVNDPAKTAITSTAWLMLNNVTDDKTAKLDNFALTIASDLLLSGPQSYFHEALLEPGYGSGLAPGSGYGNSRRETTFAVGVKGVGEDDIPVVEQKIQETLEKVAKSGFPRNRVDSTLHQIELDAAAVKPNFGLLVGIGTMSTWVHDGDALRPLRTLALARELQEKLDTDPQYWQNLLSKYFLTNKHKVTVRARSDEKYDAKLEEAENKLLKELESKLSEDDKTRIVDEGVKLKAAQDGDQNADLLPTLKVAEAVDRSIKMWGSRTETLKVQNNEIALQIDEQPTNGVVYVSAMFDCSNLPNRLMPYLDYFADYVDQIGTSKISYKDFAEKIKGVSGGISLDTISNNDTQSPLKWTKNGEVCMNIGSHCLERNADAMGDILSDVCTDAKWFGDDERLKFLIKKRSAQLGASVAQNGMAYGKAVCASKLSAIGELENLTGGLPQVQLAQRLAKSDMEGVKEVREACAEIQSLLLTPENVKRCRVASQSQDLESGKEQLAKWLSALPSTGTAQYKKTTNNNELSLNQKLVNFVPESGSKTYVAIKGQTNYCTGAIECVGYEHPDAAPLYLLSQAMSTEFLHREIREKGGAYGGGSSFVPISGMFFFSSYRDPNTTQTIDTFSKSIEWASKPGNITHTMVEEAHLRAFKSIDSPIAPASRGQSLYAQRLTDSQRQEFRTRLLDCTSEDMTRCASAYLLNKPMTVCIVGSEDKVPTAGYTCVDAEGLPLARAPSSSPPSVV